MGRIKKAATERHMATLSPFVKDFVKRATEVSLPQLPALLDSFPQYWPLPRGDLYHWIPLLDRFDHILELFIKEYALNEGPQMQPFERRLLHKGDAEEGMPYPSTGSTNEELDGQGYTEEGDRELVQSALHFTRILLEHCGNRSLYASSTHINDLLHTTSLSLLRQCLKLSLRLAQRYQVARYKNHHPSAQAILLSNHYNINLDNLHKIAQPFPKPYNSGAPLGQTPGKGKDKAVQMATFNPSDLVAIAKEHMSSATSTEMSSVAMSYYEQPATTSPPGQTQISAQSASEAPPSTPTPRRTSNLGPSRDRPSPGDRSVSANDISSTPSKSRDSDVPSNAPKLFHIPASKVAETPAWKLVKDAVPNMTPEMRYELLNRIRIAKAFATQELSNQEILEIRLFAIANLAYALTESKFQERVGIPDQEEPRRFHLAHQLCDLLQPATNGQTPLTLQTETTAIMTLEALCKSRHKAAEVAEALAISLNHGVLYYELRKVISTLNVEEHADKHAELQQAEWRESTFDLINSLLSSNAQARYGEKMVAAGIMGILVEALSLRTARAEKFHERVLQFFDTFIHGVTTAFQTLASVKGLDIIADLTAYEVDAALGNARNGNGLPPEYKSKVVDYEIPFYQQSTLRQLFKNTGHMFEHNAGSHDRLLRNLIDTPQILGSLRKVIENARIFGSNVWGGAVTIVTQFIHHEPTSYQVIGEAGLSKAFLESITEQKVPDELPSLDDFVQTQELHKLELAADGEPSYPSVRGILPVGEVMNEIPAAFGAICLNESGMQLFQVSGALDKYFDIFLSPTHVRAMEDEGQTAAGIGSSFDELARHHPRLKAQIMTAVLNMLRRLCDLCNILAEKKLSGTKLWQNHDGRLGIAGGLAALRGSSQSDYEQARTGAADFLPTKGSEPLDDPSDEDAQDRAPSIPFISALFKFLEGFFQNNGMCSLFCEESGAELLLDLAMSPSVPYDLVAFPLFNKVTAVFKVMCEARGHLVLPSIIRRTQHAILGVKDLISTRSHASSFDPFTNLAEPTQSPFPDGRDATTVVKSLVNTHLLTHVLGRVLSAPGYTLRHNNQTHHLFHNLNFTEVYIELIDELSKLHAACVWEGLLLMRKLSEDAKAETEPRPFVMRRIGANGVVEHADKRDFEASRRNSNSANGVAEQKDEKSREQLLSRKNLRTIRYLVSQVPMGIESFFHSLGQAIVSKRLDNSVKQHALMVAEHLAKALIWELDFRRNETGDEALEMRYAAGMLSMFSRMLLRSSYTGETIHSKEALVMVMVKFYVARGFDKMNEYLNRFVELLEKQGGHEKADTHVKDAIQAILGFYSQAVRTKCINETQQAQIMSQREKTQPDYFQPGQFVVEIRDAVLPAVSKIWHSKEVETVGNNNMRLIVDILRLILKSEGEDRALRRSDRPTRFVYTSDPDFKLRSLDGLQKLTKDNGFDAQLSREALYRCNGIISAAEQYCRLRAKDPRVPRFAVRGEAGLAATGSSTTGARSTQAEAAVTSAASSDIRADVEMSGASGEDQNSVNMEDDNERGGLHTEEITLDADGNTRLVLSSDNDVASDDDDDDMGTLGRLPADLRTEDLSAMVDQRGINYLTTVVASRASRDSKELYVTLDDLDDKRKALRDDLIERCLEVLSTHPGITFELADLIQAAVAKAGEAANPRADIGTTLVSSLMSLQAEEPSKESGRKIHAYAHLVALILQDRDFFDSTLDDLKEYFENLVNWVSLEPEQKTEDAPWIEMVLLIIERVLAEDEQPIEVTWEAPPADNPLQPMPQPSAPEPVVTAELRMQLFDALVDLLPKIGKNTTLALSVARVMVVLSRRRDLAGRLRDKHTMGRLFLMIRQLAGGVDDKLRGSFMLILRHMVEDDESIRQTMRAEIRVAFDNSRSARGMDTTAYTRNLYHLALRNPGVFVEVTQEMLEITRFDGHPHRPQHLNLKRTNTVAPAPVPAAEQSNGNITGEPAKPTVEGEEQQIQKAEPKMPVVETTDGVIQFLLRELSNYRDVEDKPPQPPKETPAEKPATDASAATTDVEMADASASASASASTQDRASQRARELANKLKPPFKPEEHAIYIYRCFILQCLAELLACYNKTKIEFINFSRKSETVPLTPSKPRAGTLNYLLNVLLPVGTLEHRDDLSHRKRQATATWASLVLVSLCSKTSERLATSTRTLDAGEFAEMEPELTFVRKFVLEHALRSFRDALTSADPLDERYSRLLALGDLFNRMLDEKADLQRSNVVAIGQHASNQQMGRLMYEKNFIGALTSAIAELDLNFPNAKRAVKYILTPLKQLTDLGVTLSQTSDASSGVATSGDDDEISSATSWSEEDEDDREQTPDMYRDSSLGLLDPQGDDDDDDSESEDDDDDEMDYDGYDEEMDYEEEPDHDEVVSDEDEDIDGMGEVEGVPGDVEIEVDMMMDEEDDEDDEDEDDEDDDEDMGDDFGDHMDEITGDDENASIGEHEDDSHWDDDGLDFDDDDQHHHDDGGSPHGGPLDHIAQVIGAGDPDDPDDPDGIVRIDMGDGEEEFFEDEMPPEDDEEDEEDQFGEDIVYEPEMDDEEEDLDGGWAWDPQPPAILRQPHHHHHHLHHHHRGINEVFGMLGNDLRPPHFRTHRSTPNNRDEDGINPLLQRTAGAARDREFGDMPARFPSRRTFLPRHSEHLLQDVLAHVGNNGPGIINVNLDQGAMRDLAQLPPMFAVQHGHGIPRPMLDYDMRRTIASNWPDMLPGGRLLDRAGAMQDEVQAIEFRPNQTGNRWQEEARMLFPGRFHDKATRLIASVLRALVPAAMEAKRLHEKQLEEQRAAQEKAAEEERKKLEAEKAEREEQERKAREEREAREREEAEARRREEAERMSQTAPEPIESTTMEGVEESQPPAEGQAASSEPVQAQEPPAERITISIRGRDLDITSLGIDREYIEALPEDMREEVIMTQFAEQRSQQVQSGEGPSEISREFLEALPRDIQQELIRSEQMERRRRERDEARRRAAQEGAAAQPEEMNNADFMAMLDPGLRQAVLMDADETVLAALPEEMQAEARALYGDRRPRGAAGGLAGRGLEVGGARVINGNAAAARANEIAREASRQRRPVGQMLDKAGVATLLRLMFVSLNHKSKTNLHSILSDVCKNTQNRAEVISILLSILQDGTADVNAVERSFAQLSLRAKQPAGPKTPTPLKRSLTGQPSVSPSTELSPLNIVQQCLGTLNALANDNQRVSYFFLNEHETSTSQKSKAMKKGKGKESKAGKFPINALLALLDRKLITENISVMETLASLLSQITRPLTSLLRKAKEAQEEEAAAAEAEASATAAEVEDRPTTSASDVPMQEAAEVESPDAEGAEASTAAADGSAGDSKDENKKKQKDLKPPDVPIENIRLVVNILAARECPSRTFSDSLDIIKHLSAIPGAKEVFGKELIRQAQQLGQDLLTDLQELAKQIHTAETGTDLQGMALASFSSAGSKQKKLLRALVALDHLFDAKRVPTVQTATSSSSDVDQKLKENILATLYESSTFDKLWGNLSTCLAAIRQRGNMVNVATILLPLIESLMVVCRNSALKETSGTVVSPTELAVSTPTPEARMESLFFNFTEDHRKILNELIRNNAKLMNGNLSVLAKNSKVLEFDNKRNYFSRKLHDRRSEVRMSQPALQLSVRRDQVFLDSFKSLYYKSGNEIKYGKLNIRFIGEEGIDAGGVSREWFAAMSRQMFNPDYCLFVPVASDRTTFHPNKLSEVNGEHLLFFKFIGRIIGKALYENRVLDCHFSRAVYRRILGKSVSLKDMESLDLDFYKSLVWILENDITDVTFETFSEDVDRFGVVETVDLIPNGRNIAVTEDNKHEYARLVVEYRLIKSVQQQLDHFLEGFHEIIPAELVSIFNEQELELLISGLPDIDVDDWKNNTEYHNYQATSPQIQWFWRAVRSFDKEDKAKLLQFVTGTSKVPLNGFKELEGMNGFAKFNIHRDYSNKEKLPSSHTCFNQLDLPEYESYEHLRQQLYTAITAGSEYFGFA